MNQDRLKQEVENIGVSFEKLGLPPMPSRVLGLLLLAEPPYRSFDELVSFLHASKSAISNAIKYLESASLITYKTFPGDRKRYFCISAERWGSLVAVTEKIKVLAAVFDRVLELRKAKDVDFNNQIADIRDLYLLFEKEYPRILEKWQMNRRK